MKHLLSSLLVFAPMLFVLTAQAQQAKVIKVKGQQAIVQFPAGTAPVVGEMIPVGGSAEVEGGGHTARGSRAHSLSVLGSLSTASVKTEQGGTSISSSKTIFEVSGLYGWNLEIMEFGPLLSLHYDTQAGITNKIFGVGGIF